MIEDELASPDRALEAANYAGQQRFAIEEALALAAQIPKVDEWNDVNTDREFAYYPIVEAIARTGDYNRALDIIKTNDVVSNNLDFTELITSSVAEEQLKRGDVDGAVASYHKLADTYTYGYGLSTKIARHMAQSGDLDKALKFSRSLEDEQDRIIAQTALAAVEGSKSPLWEEVEQQVKLYRDPKYPTVEDRVATAYAIERMAIGDVDTAWATLAKLSFIDSQLDLKLAIAKHEGLASPIWDAIMNDFNDSSSPLGEWLHDNHHQRLRTAVVMATAGDEARARDFVATEDESQSALNNFSISMAVGDLDQARANLTAYSQSADAKEFGFGGNMVELIKAEIRKGEFAQAETDTNSITDPDFKIQAILAKANYAADQLEALGFFPETGPYNIVDTQPKILAHQAKNIGAYTIEHWRQFKNYDGATFARLAHGAAEIAHAYMTDDERVAFVRSLGEEFSRFRDQGMFDGGKHQIVLKHLSEAMVEAGDAGTTSLMLETLYANMGEATGLRLIKSMVESGNAKAGAAGIDVLANPDTPDHVYQYLLNKLAATGYIDRELPATIVEAQSYGWPAAASRKILQTFYGKFNVQLDSDLLEWTAEKMYGDFFVKPSDVMGTLDARLEVVSNIVAKSLEEFESLSQPDLLQRLSDSEDSRALYFMLRGGRTNYSLIQHYNMAKFSQAVAKGAEIQARIDPTAIATGLWDRAPDGWQKAMEQRQRPSSSLVWQTEVGSSSHELRSQARQELRDVLGAQLTWLLADGATAKNFGEYPDDVIPALDPKLSKRMDSLLGERVSAIFLGSEEDITIGDFEKMKNNMLSQIRQARQVAKQQKDPSAAAWADILSKAQSEDPVLAMRHILALISRDPSRSLHPAGADAEWLGHVTGLSTTIRTSQRTGKDSRTLTVRYLDGKEDFAELLRFADGAQCCFTSENTIGTEMDPEGEWRMRINRDPHWFVFSIEDTPPDAAKRVSTGFVFGSVAEVDGAPAVAINGIYMQRKTDSAANSVLDGIVERFAKPMGVRSVVVATKYGGDFNIDRKKWQPGDGHSLWRPRAIMNRRGNARGELETKIYDDLGNLVNELDELDSHSWRQVITQ